VMAFGMIVIIGTPFLLHRGPSLKADAQANPGRLAQRGPVPEVSSGRR
jgi:hypothetical protein